MSFNFNANQFEREFKARRLGNWEVPKWYPDRPRPRARPQHTTSIIVNDRGHLLPGIRRPADPPWGRFLGTWDLPRRITRKIASDLTAPSGPLQSPARLSSWERRSASHIPFPGDEDQLQSPGVVTNVPRDSSPLDVTCHAENANLNHIPATGGKPSSREPYKARRRPKNKRSTPAPSRPGSHSDAATLRVTGHAATPPPKTPGVVGHSALPSPHTTPVELGLSTSCLKPITPASPPLPPPPLATAYSGFQIAKQLHSDNLRHQPLPDTVEHALYRSLEAKQAKHPGAALDVDPRAAAVGWRGYGAPGPTQCSKLRVYRPRTAGVIPAPVATPPPSSRPSTSLVKRSKLRRQNATAMELAICWDLQPASPEDEPKPSPHIDGSNGSAAPAVFTLVHQPVTPPPPEPCGSPKGCGTPPRALPRREHRPSADSYQSMPPAAADRLRARPKTAWSEAEPSRALQDKLKALSHGSSADTNNSRAQRFHRSGSMDARRPSGTLNSSGLDSTTMAKRKHYQSSPNLTNNHDATTKEDRATRAGSGSPNQDSKGSGGSQNNHRHERKHEDKDSSNHHQNSRSNPGSANSHQNNNNHNSKAHLGNANSHNSHHNSANSNNTNQHNSKVKSGSANSHNNHYHKSSSGNKKRLLQSRPCMACEVKNAQPPVLDPSTAVLLRPHSEYKMAFKAGKPNSNSSSFDSGDGATKTTPVVRVPKQRAPFAKRSYSIDTLAPPFSLWPGNTGQDYPEHWRLASVYQHAYKPLEHRRKPLLASVYQ